MFCYDVVLLISHFLFLCCVCVGLLYAVGGYDGASRHCLSSVEAYNPDLDCWKAVAEMSCRRSGAGKHITAG